MGNSDETLIYFDMPREMTINRKGEKEVKISTTGYEKHQVTLILCVTPDRNKLPPYLIFKRQTGTQKLGIFQRCNRPGTKKR